jgi:hypothetical protein
MGREDLLVLPVLLLVQQWPWLLTQLFLSRGTWLSPDFRLFLKNFFFFLLIQGLAV